MGFSDWLILVCTGLALVAGHWFPWRVFAVVLNRHGQLKRVLAYAYGVGCINAGMVAWCYTRADYAPAVFLFALSVSAGLGTVLPRVAERELKSRDTSEDRDELWHALDELKR